MVDEQDTLLDAVWRMGENNDIAEAREAFFNLLTTSTHDQIKRLRLKINQKLLQAKHNKLNAKKIFSLYAMHQELMKRLEKESAYYRINLVKDRRWINDFYGENCEIDAKALYDSMQAYARALKIEWTDRNISLYIIAVAIAVEYILIDIALKAVAGDVYKTGMVGIQIASIGLLAIAATIENRWPAMRSANLYRNLKRLKLTDHIENEEALEQEKLKNTVNLDSMGASLNDLINKLQEDAYISLIDTYIGPGGIFHPFKEVAPEEYKTVCYYLNLMEKYHKSNRPRNAEMLVGYALISGFTTAAFAVAMASHPIHNVYALLFVYISVVVLADIALLGVLILCMREPDVENGRFVKFSEHHCNTLKHVRKTLLLKANEAKTEMTTCTKQDASTQIGTYSKPIVYSPNR